MWDALHDSGILKILIAEIDFNKYEKNTLEEKEEIENNLKDRIYKKEKNILKMNDKKYNSSNKQDEEAIKRLEKQLEKIKELKDEYGDKEILGGILFLIYGNEVLSLHGGSHAKLMQFQSAYTIHFEGVKMAVEGNYNRYNFYGITGDFRKENPLYGLYLCKKRKRGKIFTGTFPRAECNRRTEKGSDKACRRTSGDHVKRNNRRTKTAHQKVTCK